MVSFITSNFSSVVICASHVVLFRLFFVWLDIRKPKQKHTLLV